MPVPLHIVSGFLGTGKTTALRDQLTRRRGERVAVLVNDFGEASIDQAMVEDAGTFALREVAGACVCCTAPEGFTDALGALLDEVGAERIFIEPTGLARPADLIDTLLRGPHRDRIALQPVIVLIDPETFDPEATDVASLVRDQAEAADVLIANRVDLASHAALARFDAWAEARWPRPLGVWRTTHGRLPEAALSWPEGEGLRAPRHAHHDHDHDHGHDDMVARSLRWSADVLFDRDRLGDALARLATGQAGAPLARLKGLFRTPEGVWLLEIAGGRVHERPTSFRRDSRVDVIVRGADRAPLDRAAAWLEDAVCTPEERATDAARVEVVLPSGARHRLDRTALAALSDGVPDVAVLIPKRRGTAARVAALLAALDAPADAEVVVVAADGYATPPVPVSALHPGLLVHTLDEGALPVDQGGPFRLLIPGDAGPGGPCANVKGVVKIVLRSALPPAAQPDPAW